MGALSPVLRNAEGGRVLFWCPGCDGPHAVWIEGPGAVWSWDKDVLRPTFAPSILVSYNGPDAGRDRPGGGKAPPARCHSFVRGGQILFCGDSTHALAGQTVPLPEWPKEYQE